MRIGLFTGPGAGEGGSTLGYLVNSFERAEAAGFQSAWLPNIFAHDALTVLALAGRATSSLELGTFVIPTYPRHPLALAQQALTASEATGGRLVLGIGLSHRVVIEDMMGLDFSKPIRHMREYLTVLMPLLRGEAVRFRGAEYRVAAQLSVPAAKPPTVIVAALGPQMLRLTGQLADGTGTWMGSAKYLRDVAVPTITAAARDAGRPAPRVIAGMPVAVTAKVAEARESANKSFAIYGTLPSYRATLDRGGAANPADMAMIGPEAELERQVEDLAAAGVTDLNVNPFAVEGDPGAVQRTQEFFAALARRGK